ncbi:MAG: LPS export ABC transporter periplasmic protein LptC [Elusimicrobia bacterium GWC2_65_9]|nr:MAG: LPS export ABC transporter periplasmic protein LptC [Elusimicrobia bacterium GWA2_66_18]OGR74101.1 MAG: LPS export ABC transporter periplasmic protein LptC [Elusimicrobia bacterium GWC2_65_9]
MRRSVLAVLLAAASCAPRREPAQDGRRQVIEGLTLSQSMGGRPSWTLRSRLAVLHEDEQEAELSAPSMDFYRDGRIVSRVAARGGAVDTEKHDVRLSSSVVVDSLEDHSRLTTEELLYSCARDRFFTSADVRLQSPEGVMRGRGLESSPDLSEIRIFDQSSVLNGKPR